MMSEYWSNNGLNLRPGPQYERRAVDRISNTSAFRYAQNETKLSNRRRARTFFRPNPLLAFLISSKAPRRRAGRFLFPCFPRFPESPDKRKGRSRFRELVARDSEYQLQVQCPCDTVDAK